MSSSITSLRRGGPAPALSWWGLVTYSKPSGLFLSRWSLMMVAPTNCPTVEWALSSLMIPGRRGRPGRRRRCRATPSASASPSARRFQPSPVRCASTRRPPAGVRASRTWTVLASVSAATTAVWPPVCGLPRLRGWRSAVSPVHLWRTNWPASALTPLPTAGAEVGKPPPPCQHWSWSLC